MLTTFTLALTVTLSHQPASLVRSSSVHLRLDQDGGVSVSQLRTAIDEVRRIWSAAGLRITFARYADPVPVGEGVISVRIVREEWQRGETPILGRTFHDRHKQSTSIFISASGLQKFLGQAQFRGRSLRQLPSALVGELEARALGRVLAHELGHCLLRDGDHSQRGLMRPSYTPDDLVSAHVQPFSLGLDERLALQRAVARLVVADAR